MVDDTSLLTNVELAMDLGVWLLLGSTYHAVDSVDAWGGGGASFVRRRHPETIADAASLCGDNGALDAGH
ncbi:hypothetical protein Nepgr_007408 [Nepenthes gracilis]|uniref:Uncharacterized protein n=1 Tax=Nepenthes gracilis TaxID=150966 RepID=A0AAD3S6S6_NEPGR|nr:hypothetical protein Nepgr_007408 [Nepenthes gracilis]